MSVLSASVPSPAVSSRRCARLPSVGPPRSEWTSSDRQILFNRIAPVYDRLNDLLTVGQHRVWKRMSVSWSGAKKGDSVLDLCCGSGDLAFLLSEKVGPHGKVTAVDFSKDQLSIASTKQQLFWKACYQNIEWIEGDALDLPFEDATFDAVTMGFGLRNLVDRYKAFNEIYRVLKEGSRVSILDFNKSTDASVDFLQGWIIDNVVVPAGNAYGLSKEYAYLRSSIAEFLTGKEQEKMAVEVGFSNVRHYEIAGGLMGNLVASR
ncbi:2-phytyl-1-4-beta-naphthoquinone methyltransferase [Nymphaea thermarum]|nr:2-phytyl-1-4-beta-naphthoquinone methyltransferase [Nymphaea thermarum]